VKLSRRFEMEKVLQQWLQLFDELQQEVS